MISVLLATTGRPMRAEICAQQLRDTTEHHRVELIAAVDHDPLTAAALKPLADVLLYSDDYIGCSQAWNNCLAASSGDPVVLAADDLVWHQGWLDEALKVLAEFPGGWGMVGFNDGNWDESLSTHYLMSRKFIVDVLGGVVAWPFYKHSFNDLETNERAKRAGRYAWAQKALVRHDHWTYGTREADETDQRNLGQHPSSEQIYRERAAAGFPNDYEAVIKS